MQDVMNSSFPDVELEFLPRSLEKVQGMLQDVQFMLPGKYSRVASLLIHIVI